MTRPTHQPLTRERAAEIYDQIPKDGSWITMAEVAAKTGTTVSVVGRACRQLRHQVVVIARLHSRSPPAQVRRHPDMVCQHWGTKDPIANGRL